MTPSAPARAGAVATASFDPAARVADAPAAGELAAALPRLMARAREVAASVVHGAHGRKRAGIGETFWQYRPAEPGEPSHRIDWRRSARSDHLYVREREWEAARSFYLWMDASPSMAFKSSLGGDYKIDRAALIGLAVAEALVRGGERVGLVGAAPPVATRDVIERLAGAWLDGGEPASKEEIPPQAKIPTRGKLILISDFLCDTEKLKVRLSEFADAGALGALLLILDPSEEFFPFSGEALFLSTEGRAPFHAGRAESLRADYDLRFAEHYGRIDAAAKSVGFPLVKHHTDRPAAEAALALLMALGEEGLR